MNTQISHRSRFTPQAHSARRFPLLRVGIFCVAVALLMSGQSPLRAYEADPTHLAAAKKSVELAVGAGGYDELQTYRQAIQNAVVAEDNPPRFVHHFYDPTTSLGLPQNTYTQIYADIETKQSGSSFGPQSGPGLRYMSAVDWGREGMPDDLDWQGAIEAYDDTPEGRRKAYEAVGHVLHLLQDMGQPDHASNRPHPGNVVGLKLQPFGLYKDRVGYETLWQLRSTPPTWPRGTTPVQVDRLEDFFNGMAGESKAAESSLGLPMSDEVALGLGAINVNAVSLVGSPSLSGGLLAKRAAAYLLFRDNLWEKYEVEAPIAPTIPYPNGQDDRTRRYIRLGDTLLPRVEEYGAGLLMFFHDIVNPPPYVASVEIAQEGSSNYKHAWDGPDQSTVRTSVVVHGDGKLQADMEATVTIKFGPLLPGADGAMRGKAVQDVEVWLEPERSSGGAACGGPGATQVDGVLGNPETGRPDAWTGRFTPVKSSTLCIKARDTQQHFESRQDKGDMLDADPATKAKAKAEPPYEWHFYEPGVDRNHRFDVRLCSAPLSEWARFVERWHGTLEVSYELSVNPEQRLGYIQSGYIKSSYAVMGTLAKQRTLVWGESDINAADPSQGPLPLAELHGHGDTDQYYVKHDTHNGRVFDQVFRFQGSADLGSDGTLLGEYRTRQVGLELTIAGEHEQLGIGGEQACRYKINSRAWLDGKYEERKVNQPESDRTAQKNELIGSLVVFGQLPESGYSLSGSAMIPRVSDRDTNATEALAGDGFFNLGHLQLVSNVSNLLGSRNLGRAKVTWELKPLEWQLTPPP